MTRAGLPIAAYLAALVALALAAAFVAVVAVVLWLPPRPPDVMRADIVADQFAAGYDYMRVNGRPIDDDMDWAVRRAEPESNEPPRGMVSTQHRLAGRLRLHPDQVRITAAKVARSDVMVFRVREAEVREHARHAVRAAREAMLEARRNNESEDIIRAHEDVLREAQAAAREAQAAAREALSEVEAEVGRDMETRRLPDREPPRAPRAPRHSRHGDGVPEAPEPPEPPAPPRFAPAPLGVVLISGFEIGAQLPDGRWLIMRQGRNWAEIGWIGRAVLIIGGALAVVSLLSLLFARRLTRPIRNFSDAVQAVGVNPQSEPVREEGPAELRGAARAVNSMQARLRALIADRTKTLAAVAHDMRTPLMRLRLQAEHVAPEQREKMAKEIEEVEALVASFIAFARDDPAEEARVRLDLAALLQSIADDHAEAGRDVTYAGDERAIITGQSLGLKRVFSNLVDNALKYGERARITLTHADGQVIVDVEDDGPGVPPAQRETVFEPFVRLNEEGTRGAGLGLAAARSIARAHGGDIVILDTEKGAKLRVILPG
jgi:signal transduction histidine kinase